jgi:predicted DNA binding CopG/RHH family protein
METIRAVETGRHPSLSDEKFEREKAWLEQVATQTVRKRTQKRSLNIRLFEEDIEQIKAIALREGLPYQTYLSSMVHKIVTGQYKPAI